VEEEAAPAAAAPARLVPTKPAHDATQGASRRRAEARYASTLYRAGERCASGSYGARDLRPVCTGGEACLFEEGAMGLQGGEEGAERRVTNLPARARSKFYNWLFIFIGLRDVRRGGCTSGMYNASRR
jgi:hypothetical protein